MSRYLKNLYVVTLAVAAVAGSTVSYADESDGSKGVFYVGAGAASTGNPQKSDDRPMSIGFISASNPNGPAWGLDFSGEGTKLESNGSRTTVKQATSINVLLGTNLGKSENTRFDAALLLGARTSSSTCPTSYLGFQCYADEPPKTSYDFNFGVVATVSYKSLVLGVRATGQSTQALVGFRF